MKNYMRLAAGVLLLPVVLSGCYPVGTKTMNLTIIYAITAMLSILLLIGYCTQIRKKDAWFLLLFSCVCIVNAGYFCLATSETIGEALLANRISYLGSVFLPFSMLMIILNVCRFSYRTLLPGVLLAVSIGVFLVAASPGYLDIYYSEVSLGRVDGATVLQKVYGPWHSLYLFYLIAYFAAMLLAAGYAAMKKNLESPVHAFILICAVFVNIAVWLLEQLAQINFEFLSVSYIISELFLLGLYLLLQEERRIVCDEQARSAAVISAEDSENTVENITVYREEKRRVFRFLLSQATMLCLLFVNRKYLLSRLLHRHLHRMNHWRKTPGNRPSRNLPLPRMSYRNRSAILSLSWSA